jgi:hypothetical protein
MAHGLSRHQRCQPLCRRLVSRQAGEPACAADLLSNDLWLRFDPSGYLLARHKRFWMLNQFEIPERLVRPLEAKWLGWQWLSLDDYATLAAAISDEQARGFTQARVRSSTQFHTAFSNFPLYYDLPALRFWASLSACSGGARLRANGFPKVRSRCRSAGSSAPRSIATSRRLNNSYATCPTTTMWACVSPQPSVRKGYQSFRGEALQQSPDTPCVPRAAAKTRTAN